MPIADLQIPNSTAGFASLIGWLQTHRPGPEVVVGVEGTRGYGIGLTRALHAAGYKVVQVDPSLHRRRGKGKSDSIDAHQCVLAVLNMNLDRLPTPRSDGDREALRILLTAHNDMTLAWTATSNRLHALLLSGNDRDRDASRGEFTLTGLAALLRRRLSAQATREQAVRHDEVRRLANALRELHDQRRTNRSAILELVTEMAPGLTDRVGVGPISAAQAWSATPTPAAAATRPPSPPWPAPTPSRPAAATPTAAGSTAAGIANSTAPCTSSP